MSIIPEKNSEATSIVQKEKMNSESVQEGNCIPRKYSVPL